jgi:hypothetical protein
MVEGGSQDAATAPGFQQPRQARVGVKFLF